MATRNTYIGRYRREFCPCPTAWSSITYCCFQTAGSILSNRPTFFIASLNFALKLKRIKMPIYFYVVLSLLIGAMLSIYLPMNSAVSKYLGSPITANITFFFVALVTSIFIFAVWGEHNTILKLKKVPLWLYLTGVVSAFIILGTTFLIPKIGVRKFFVLMISGQILMAIIVSHFGLIGTPKDLITIKKGIGAIFIVIGILFSTM